MAKERGIKIEKTLPKEVIDVRNGAEDRRRAARLEKNINFAKGSKYIPNTEQSQQYRYKRKQEKLLA